MKSIAGTSRYWAVIILIFMSLLAAAEEKVYIDLGTLTGPDDPKTLSQRVNKQILSRFKEKYPQYGFKLTESLRLFNQQTMDAIIMQMAGGTAPDILYIPFRNSTSFVDQGFCYPLDEYVEQWSKEVNINDKIHPQLWQVIKRVIRRASDAVAVCRWRLPASVGSSNGCATAAGAAAAACCC